MAAPDRPVDAALRVFLVTGEHSGDALGASLMRSMRSIAQQPIVFEGLGGAAMQAEGLESLFPLDEVTVMGPLAILKAYPRLRRRALEVVAAGIAADPDVIVIIDAPEFTHPIAKRIRKARPRVPIINYVSPSVWAWRSGRAKKMRPYVDHVLALLPFEPAAHMRLGGPPCTYVGHPLVGRLDWIDALDPSVLAHRLSLAAGRKRLVVLPGSRTSEVSRLMRPFGEAVARVAADVPVEVLIPAVPRQRDAIAVAAQDWPVPVHLVDGEEDKWRAFKLADAALAASGTVTLELGVVGVPMVVGYKVDAVAARLRFLLNVPSVVLANLVLGDTAFPEFIQEACEAPELAEALAPLLSDTDQRSAQKDALTRLRSVMLQQGADPSEAAARVVMDHFARAASPR
ncbi:MAG: lipid-A-disaccharide synthase [Hyphomicrobiaceae bacterium]